MYTLKTDLAKIVQVKIKKNDGKKKVTRKS